MRDAGHDGESACGIARHRLKERLREAHRDRPIISGIEIKLIGEEERERTDGDGGEPDGDEKDAILVLA